LPPTTPYISDITFENRLLRKTAVFPLQMPLPDIIEFSDRWQVGLIQNIMLGIRILQYWFRNEDSL